VVSLDRVAGTSAAPTMTSGDDGVLLRAVGLTETFGRLTAVDGIDLAVGRGEAFGFLGPNGAGKFSTIKMIDCAPVTSGELFGEDSTASAPQIRAPRCRPAEGHPRRGAHRRGEPLIYGRFFGLGRAEVRSRAVDVLELAQRSTGPRTRWSRCPGG